MTLDDRELVKQTAVWTAMIDVREIDPGLDPVEALSRADDLLRLLAESRAPKPPGTLDDASIDVLHAACRLLDGSRPNVLSQARALYEFVSSAEWPSPDFDEHSELLSGVALAAWRVARQGHNMLAASLWATRIDDATAREILETPIKERPLGALSWDAGGSQNLLAICNFLRDRLDYSPAKNLDEAEFFYYLLEKQEWPSDLFDERGYFLGELALIAGTACRLLSRREEARRWFNLAESGYCNTVNGTADLARLAYQRLALRAEEGHVDVVMELGPSLVETFQNLGMAEDAVKSRFLQGLALLNSARLAEAARVFTDICKQCEELSQPKLLAAGLVNLTHVYALLGDSAKAVEASRRAIPLQREVNDRIGLAKVLWGLGTVLREQGQLSAAIEFYRSSQRELASLGMRADIAALNLLVADLLFVTGQQHAAIREILAALPVIDQVKMVPEAVAALSLLRESLRKQKINLQALRDLQGYFEKLNK